MRQGNFVHQVAMSFSLDPYHPACGAIDPSSMEGQGLHKRGYLLVICVDAGDGISTWQCRYAGHADQIRQAWTSDPTLATDAGVDSQRLCHWFDGVLSTAIPATRLGLDAFAGLVAQLRWDGNALGKGREDPLTLALASSGALNPEASQLHLEADSLGSTEMRLGWLLATSSGTPAPRFALESPTSLNRLCLKLCRLHAMTLGRVH